jgi:hypothetical protein
LQLNFETAHSSRYPLRSILSSQRQKWRTLLAKVPIVMSESIRPGEQERSAPTPGALLAPVDGQEEARSFLRRQLPLIREMIRDLEEQTGSGRRCTMEKIVALFRQQIGPEVLIIGQHNAGGLSYLVDQLANASEHLIPDVRHFTGRVETLLSLLLATV